MRTVRQEVKRKTVGYIVAALGLVAGLAWNDAIKSLIDYLFPLSGNSVWAKFTYALIITLAAVSVSVYLLRLVREDIVEKGKRK